MPWLAAGAIAAPLLGGIIGGIAAGEDREKASGAAQAAIDEINAVGAPPDLSKQIIREKFEQVGILTPELEQQIDMGMSQLQNVQEDQQLKQAQLSALTDLQKRGKVGLSPEDRAALNEMRAQITQDSEAKRQQVMQSLQSRGMGGSGAELASQLAASQAGTNLQAQQSDRLSAEASQRALQAMSQSGQMAGQMQQSQFEREAQKAKAADLFRQFDVQNQQAQQQRNISAKNIAQQQNLGTKQRIAEANVTQTNEERLRQAAAQRQFWLDQMDRAKARSAAQLGASKLYSGQADATAEQWGKVGAGVGSAAGGVFGYGMQYGGWGNPSPEAPKVGIGGPQPVGDDPNWG